ncbi:12841_t:CDS:2 [Gigaspora margarita]|uniref:12841_t:CDS:1 n=1 Tax=Gigaspora margarita TaxID=4874 RepID=A0ABN7V9X8_GIGMA|nr:12841_t:CDS:2 [Gigaspora margarita]
MCKKWIYWNNLSSVNNYIELYNILICIEPFKYPHTSDHIHNTIISKITFLDLINKVKVAVTNSALQKIKPYIKRYKKLSSFFNSPKQNKKLEEVQHQLLLRYEDSECLKELKDSIKHVIFKLSLETSKEAQDIKKCVLKYWK